MNIESFWALIHSSNTADERQVDIKYNKLELEAFVSNAMPIEIGLNPKAISNYDVNYESLVHSIALLTDRILFAETLEKLNSHSKLEIISPLSGEVVCSSVSFCSHLKNFIRYFDSKYNEVFYLIQNHQFIAGFYFPKQNLYIKIAGGNVKGYVSFLMHTILQNTSVFLQKINFTNDKKVSIVSSCPRPWHFFYNYCTVLSIIEDREVSIDNMKFFYFEGGDFIDIAQVFSSINLYSKITQKIMNTETDSFFLLLGVSYDSITLDEHKSLQKKVMASVSNYQSEIILDKSNINVWIGVSSQKRTWVEQQEGIKKVIEHLYSKYSNICIVFDGWTAPIHNTESNKIQADNDSKVVNAIINGLSFKLSYKSVIGSCVMDKLSAATQCDFYIANYASGSIIVSRFAGLQGLSHLNNLMPREHHVHHNNIEISSAIVNDISEEGKTGHHISYSINPDLFLEAFVEFFNNLKIASINSLRLEI